MNQKAWQDGEDMKCSTIRLPGRRAVSLRRSPKRELAKCMLFASALLWLVACKEEDHFKSVDTEPIEATVKTAVPLGYATSASIAVMNGAALSNVEVLETCGEFPCTVLLRISPDEQSLPYRLGVTGDMLVVGFWTSPTQGILSVSFLDETAGSESYAVSTIATFPVTIADGTVKLVYADIDIDVVQGPIDTIVLTDPEVAAELDRLETEAPTDQDIALGMDSWIIQVDTKGTQGDLNDDEYTISGSGQYVAASSSSASIYQLALVQTIMSSGCEANPLEGIAVIQEAAASSGFGAGLPLLAMATLEFHSDCDGEAQVLVATGNYLTSIGQPIHLHF